jgi:Tol biopolymer transport system component
MRADGSNQHDVSNAHAAQDHDADWSPDGTKIAFISDRAGVTGGTDILVMNPDGSGQIDLSNDAGRDFAPEWSPDGIRLSFRNDRTGNNDIWVMDADGSDQTNLTNNPAKERHPSWSPDGSMIACHHQRRQLRGLCDAR